MLTVYWEGREKKEITLKLSAWLSSHPLLLHCNKLYKPFFNFHLFFYSKHCHISVQQFLCSSWNESLLSDAALSARLTQAAQGTEAVRFCSELASFKALWLQVREPTALSSPRERSRSQSCKQNWAGLITESDQTHCLLASSHSAHIMWCWAYFCLKEHKLYVLCDYSVISASAASSLQLFIYTFFICSVFLCFFLIFVSDWAPQMVNHLDLFLTPW